jgi:alkaline phosphatase D
MAAVSRRLWLAAAAGSVAAPGFVRHARAADTERFALGVASGCPRERTVVLWTRLTGEALPGAVKVDWQLAEDEAFERIVASGSGEATAAWGHSVHAEPQGLAPGRWYWYRFSALGQRSRVGRTRTLPAAGTLEPLKFSVASCQRWDHGHWAAWRQMAEDELDLVLFVGDYIYEYAPVPGRIRPHEGFGLVRTLADYRARYAQYKSDPALQRMHARAPWIVVWDDHEVDNDYAALQSQTLESGFAFRRAAAYQAYWEHMPFPKRMRPGPGRTDMRIHERYDWGALARVLTLDDRQHRDPQACPRPGRGGSNTVLATQCAELFDPKRSLLGSAQERWLSDSWRGNTKGEPPPWNLLAQQTLMARFNWRDPASGDTNHWTDGWDGYPAARSRLLDEVAQRALPNVVVLGGDVHTHYVADLHADFNDIAASPVVATEFCGTSISSHGMEQSRLDRALPFNPHIRYGRSDRRGYLRFALDAKRLEAELMAVESPDDPASAVKVAARFVVKSGKPGAQPA